MQSSSLCCILKPPRLYSLPLQLNFIIIFFLLLLLPLKTRCACPGSSLSSCWSPEAIFLRSCEETTALGTWGRKFHATSCLAKRQTEHVSLVEETRRWQRSARTSGFEECRTQKAIEGMEISEWRELKSACSHKCRQAANYPNFDHKTMGARQQPYLWGL